MQDGDIDLMSLDKEGLERMSLIVNFRKQDEEIRNMRERREAERERYEKERIDRLEKERIARERYEKEREEYLEQLRIDRERFEVDLQMRRERHEHEMLKLRRESEKMRQESIKLAISWLLLIASAFLGAYFGAIEFLKVIMQITA